jgi:hypothetical protein
MRNVVGGMGVAVHYKHTVALSALARGWSTPIGAKGGLRWLGGPLVVHRTHRLKFISSAVARAALLLIKSRCFLDEVRNRLRGPRSVPPD